MIVSAAEANHGLNEYQQRRLLVTCQYIEKLLFGVEEVLNAASPRSAEKVRRLRGQHTTGVTE